MAWREQGLQGELMGLSCRARGWAAEMPPGKAAVCFRKPSLLAVCRLR